MSNVLVFRLEHTTQHTGPWSANYNLPADGLDALSEIGLKIVPISNEVPGFTSDYKCAFDDLDTTIDMFDPLLPYLSHDDWQISQYRTDEKNVLYSSNEISHQVGFLEEYAELCDSIAI